MTWKRPRFRGLFYEVGNDGFEVLEARQMTDTKVSEAATEEGDIRERGDENQSLKSTHFCLLD